MSWTFVNDSYMTNLCLEWEPEVIAVAALYLACYLVKFKVPDWTGRTAKHSNWWDQFVDNLTPDVLEEICHKILDSYNESKREEEQQNAAKEAAARAPVPPPLPPPPVARQPPPPPPPLVQGQCSFLRGISSSEISLFDEKRFSSSRVFCWVFFIRNFAIS